MTAVLSAIRDRVRNNTKFPLPKTEICYFNTQAILATLSYLTRTSITPVSFAHRHLSYG